MTSVEFWGLIINGVSALGTVGAVVVALWLALPNWKKFSIKNVRVSVLINPDKSQTSNLLIMINNCQHASLYVHYIELNFSYPKPHAHTTGKYWSLKNEVIPPLSQFEIKVPLEQGHSPNSLKNAEEITLDVKTSYGDKTIKFPEKYKPALFQAMEVKKPQECEAA